MSEHTEAPIEAIDLAELEQLAAAATPGPYRRWTDEVMAGDTPIAYDMEEPDADYLVAAANAVPAFLALVTAADAFVGAYTALEQPWVLEKSSEAIGHRKAMNEAVAAYQAARGPVTSEEGS